MARRARPLLFCTLALGFGSAATGQQLDYGGFEGMFGEPVTMSATGKPERVSDTPVMMDIITADDIRRSGVRDLPTLLRRLPGVDMTHSSPGTEELSMGGYVIAFGSRIMVLLNGRQIYSDAFGEVYWSSLPVELDEIRQIEVIHGPQSALYGFNAVDGVINIVTFDPVQDPINSARVRVGNDARRDGSVTVTQSLGAGAGVRLTVAGDHAHDNGLDTAYRVDDGYEKNPDRLSGSVTFGMVLPDGGRFGLEASRSDMVQRGFIYSVAYNGRFISDAVKADYTTETGIGRIDATASYSNISQPWVRNPVFSTFAVGDQALVAQVSDLFKVGPADSFRLGLEARRDALQSQAVIGGTVTGDLGAGSAMWEHSFSNSLSIVDAVRYDDYKLSRSGPIEPYDIYTNADFDRSVQGFSFNSALIDKVTDVDSLRLSAARGLILPSLSAYDEMARFTPTFASGYIFGNPYLIPSPVYDYQFGWDHDISQLGATARVNLFHELTMHHVSSPIELTSVGLTELTVESAGSVANGLQFEIARKATAGWQWGLNYTYTRIDEHQDLGFHRAEPMHKLNASLGYSWEQWDADLYGGYTSATDGTVVNPANLFSPVTVVPVRHYLTLAPHVAWRPVDWVTLELSADNLWPYRDTPAQRNEVLYFLSVKVDY